MVQNKPSNTSSTNEKLKAEHILQAVVVADAAEPRFRPLTLTRPRCLLPLANMPLIDYTLEFLAVAGVEEIFVFCKSHADQIKEYLANSKWSKAKGSLKIHTILAPHAYGVGDVMRELDSKSLIQTDFILVSGNVVSNMKLDKVLEEHRNRRAANKDAIMTMVMKRAAANHRSCAHGESALVVLDPINNECVHFEQITKVPRKKRVAMDMELFKKHPTLQIHSDLLDCQIDICSVEVPALFTENFDYQDIRTDFVHGVLTSDLLGKSIFVHTIAEEYAARVRSTYLYDSISKDVMYRWSFPMVPDSNFHADHTYRHRRGNVYLEHDVVLSRSCIAENNVIIGSRTEIGEQTRVVGSVIGRNCRIGSNVLIEGSYIWDNVVIEDGCTIIRSIIADGAAVKSNSFVDRGCIISFNVVVGPDISLHPFTKLTAVLPRDEDFKDIQKLPVNVIGDEGNAYPWMDKWDSDDEEAGNRLVRELGYDSIEEASDASDTDYDSDDLSSDNMGEFDHEEELHRHYKEVEETIRRAISENHTVDNAALELNALKLACNITFEDLRQVVIPFLVNIVDANGNISESAKKVFGKWGALVSKFVDSLQDQLDCMRILLEESSKKDASSSAKLFMAILTCLYQLDVIEGDAVISWYEKHREWCTDENRKRIAQQVSKFVEWLEESEDDEEEESD